MNGKADETRWATQVVVEFDRSLFRHVGVAQWNAFVGELVRRGLTPVAWSKGKRPPPIQRHTRPDVAALRPLRQAC